MIAYDQEKNVKTRKPTNRKKKKKKKKKKKERKNQILQFVERNVN